MCIRDSSSQGTAIIFVVCGVVTLLTVVLSKWGIRESDRWHGDDAGDSAGDDAGEKDPQRRINTQL